MRMLYVALFISIFFQSSTSLAQTPDNDNAETNRLYSSCQSALAENKASLQDNYCHQMILAMYPAIYVTRHILADIAEENETSCDKRKFDIIKDIQTSPPSNNRLEFFLPKNIAKNFVEFIESGTDIADFPLLYSTAERAMAQSILNWDKRDVPIFDEATKKENLSAIAKTMEGGNKPDAFDLMRSCKKTITKDAAPAPLCEATISGVLIIYSLVKNHLPTSYPSTHLCHEEKNALLAEFTAKRLRCFPDSDDLKKQIAKKISDHWKPEFDTPEIGKTDTAAYLATSIISQLYPCPP